MADNGKDRARFRRYLLREWPERGEHRSAVHFALLMLESEDTGTGEIRVSIPGLARQYPCHERKVYGHLKEIKDLGFFEVCGTWWPESQLERKRAGLPARPCNVYRRSQLPIRALPIRAGTHGKDLTTRHGKDHVERSADNGTRLSSSTVKAEYVKAEPEGELASPRASAHTREARCPQCHRDFTSPEDVFAITKLPAHRCRDCTRAIQTKPPKPFVRH